MPQIPTIWQGPIYKYDLKRGETIDGIWALVSTVKERADKYTRRALKRASQARKFQNIIMRPGERKFKEVCLRHLQNYPITKGDVAIANDVFGRNLGSIKGKTPRSVASWGRPCPS